MKGPGILKMGVGAARYRLTGHRVPLHAMLILTRQCSSVCSHCNLPSRPAAELPTQSWVEIIDALAKQGTVRISLSGGEPLLRPDIAAIVERCTGHGIWTSLETDGALVPQKMQDLKSLNQWIFPLDGRPAVHDRLREPGAQERVLRAIRLTREQGMAVWTSTLLCKESLKEIPWILDFAEANGCVASFQVLQGCGAPYSNRAERQMAAPDDCRRSLRWLLEARNQGRPVGLSEKTLRYLLSWEDYRQATSLPPREDLHCLAGQLYCAIDADGSILACPMKIGQAGLKAQDGLSAAFESLRENPCQACTSSALTEYNYLYNLNPPSLYEWLRSGRWREAKGAA